VAFWLDTRLLPSRCKPERFNPARVGPEVRNEDQFAGEETNPVTRHDDTLPHFSAP
jgi:hypothetical protein